MMILELRDKNGQKGDNGRWLGNDNDTGEFPGGMDGAVPATYVSATMFLKLLRIGRSEEAPWRGGPGPFGLLLRLASEYVGEWRPFMDRMADVPPVLPPPSHGIDKLIPVGTNLPGPAATGGSEASFKKSLVTRNSQCAQMKTAVAFPPPTFRPWATRFPSSEAFSGDPAAPYAKELNQSTVPSPE
ncbi:uncharacterized protein MCYG_01046 [Microsporum canis CBS 113480]|uniref:Uncharacterized protein n=1 Tax=Arthroderma otae (strain ATCC MYA-4605 / CBS 113480) TaxID=554155 RepID=C5FEC4_ARTOC|nr:uncharacterized protein MCYG_01046 [Microsporum canis CBS 113480]EEQ28158.1 predicted protein [Microsporum canis CBS 113480]